MIDGYKELANAVILQAVKDFRASYRRIKRFPEDKDTEIEVRELTKFFCSEYFEILTNVDGPMLLRRIIDDTDAGSSIQLYRKKTG